MKVAILTQIEKESLEGELIQPSWGFYASLDCNGNWIISQQEIDNSIYPQNDWIKSLPLIDWCGDYIPISGLTENYLGNTL
jgi:hypothetical protein